LHDLRTVRQRSYYDEQIGFVTLFAQLATWIIAVVLGLGAILAIANALGMALAARHREIAVLRAVGFGQAALAIALLIEVCVIAASCAGVAILIGWFALEGRGIDSSTGDQALRFFLHLSPGAALGTLLYNLGLGVAASLWPILRAVRASLVSALQSE